MTVEHLKPLLLMPTLVVIEDGTFRERTDVQRALARTERGAYPTLGRSTRPHDGIAYRVRTPG